jgi:TRAP-type mannitol/chloroaromatic compound transport system substrate-binding protein
MAARAVAIAALLMLAGWPASAADDEPVTLVTPLVYGTHLPGLGKPALGLAELIKQGSDGAVMLELKEPGEGPKPHEILDKVSDGSVDAGYATASFWAAQIPAAPLFSGFPFGPDAKTYLAWFDEGNGRKLHREMYAQGGYKVHVIPCAFGGPEAGGWFTKEIATPKDLDGLRMRIFGLGARVMSRLGVVPVLVPGGNLAKAFDKKDIDAAELYTPTIDREQGLQDKAKILYMPGWHQPETVFELIINKERWDKLGPQRQAIVEDACKTTLQTTLGESAGLQAEALAALSTKDSVQVLPWPDDVLEALRGAWAEVAKEEGARDYFFKAVLEDIEAFRTKASGAAEAAPNPAPANTAP